MSAAIALAAIAVQLLPTIEVGATELIAFINSIRTTAQQTGDWTDAQEAAFRAAMFARTQDPAYKP